MKKKNQDDYITHVFQWLGYDKQFTVPPLGLRGGLALFWKHDIDLQILASYPYFIDARIKINQKFYTLLFRRKPRKILASHRIFQ